MKNGLIHIYTGEGKGKTTAAVGLAVRALGHGMKVLYLYFNKQPGLYGYNEIQNLKLLGAKVVGFDELPGVRTSRPEQLADQTIRNLTELSKIVKDYNPDVLILDEILISVQYGMLNEQELMDFIAQKPVHVELVLTGRGASEELIGIADYVSNIQKIKHPFDRKIVGRVGIEF